MRIVLQRVKNASVSYEDQTHSIKQGLVLLIGIHASDSKEIASKLAQKCAELRIFEDADGKMNRSLVDLGGEILAVSQFTLYGNTKKGRRPSFIDAAKPDISEPLYDFFVSELKKANLPVKTGKFGADMQVTLQNDGPVTLILEE